MIRARSCARSAALAIGLAALGGALHAEIIANGDQVSVRETTVARPGRGMSMKAVEAKFGAPQQRHGAVGKPPITRWDYPAFTVFFEYEHVIDAVVNPEPEAAQTPDAAPESPAAPAPEPAAAP
jgi:hypothetical protein